MIHWTQLIDGIGVTFLGACIILVVIGMFYERTQRVTHAQLRIKYPGKMNYMWFIGIIAGCILSIISLLT